ncbi:MAG: type II toxin-antitoxin system prevent-host-death family antitoxin [Neisseria sp.]|jgi:antitoxin YefM|nr:type II toxin-antitoxin system prevent-host-death family antitoxin [Neisseria sp.]
MYRIPVQLKILNRRKAMDKVISYTNVRENLAQIMTEVCEDHIVAHITRRNGQNCVLISEEEYDSIRESLYLFGNPANAAHLERSIAEAERGDFVQIDL